jgi:hypothetical protein
MPSISTTDGFTRTNWGPVTTTVTPPASCTTGPGDIVFALKENGTLPFFEFAAECSTSGWIDCVPTGTAHPTPTFGTDAAGGYVYSYYSPGLYCPSGWATVGIAAQDADKSLSYSGILTTDMTPTPLTLPDGQPPQQWRIHTLCFSAIWTRRKQLFCAVRGRSISLPNMRNQANTWVSSMTANLGLGCYSTVSDYKILTGCKVPLPSADYSVYTKTYVVDGTITAEELRATITGTILLTSTISTTFDPEAISALEAVSNLPMVTLVHRPADLQAASTSKSGNAAARVRASSDNWAGLGSVPGVSAAAMVLGAAIIFP